MLGVYMLPKLAAAAQMSTAMSAAPEAPASTTATPTEAVSATRIGTAGPARSVKRPRMG